MCVPVLRGLFGKNLAGPIRFAKLKGNSYAIRSQLRNCTKEKEEAEARSERRAVGNSGKLVRD
jgi:hypothetical protein